MFCEKEKNVRSILDEKNIRHEQDLNLFGQGPLDFKSNEPLRRRTTRYTSLMKTQLIEKLSLTRGINRIFNRISCPTNPKGAAHDYKSKITVKANIILPLFRFWIKDRYRPDWRACRSEIFRPAGLTGGNGSEINQTNKKKIAFKMYIKIFYLN